MAKRKRKRSRRRSGASSPAEGSPLDAARPLRRSALPKLILGIVGATALIGLVDLGLRPSSSTDELPMEVGARPHQSQDGASSHQKMLETLEAIRRETPDLNLWQGERPAVVARSRLAQLPSDASLRERWERLCEVAYQELRLGREEEAIQRYREAYALLPEIVDEIGPEEAIRTVFRLAVAYLRYGETRNCSLRHSGESCILPIRGAGLHSDEEGSRQAIRYFYEVLENAPGDHPVYLKAMWLYNIAHMTLGEYPKGVAERYRVPPEIFASDEPFPRFENRAPELGLASFNLFGGVVADDFDGDGWLDILTSTFDTGEAIRLFHNEASTEGDLSFVEQSTAAGLAGLYGGLNLIQADYDNDGDLDVYVLRGAWLSIAGRHPNSLLRNEGNQEKGQVTFTDVTFDAGLAEVSYPTQTGAWADYDNDGDVDLFVGNEHGDAHFDGPCQLFRNDGDGTFTDVARQAGVDHRGFVKGVIWGDYDEDRFPDLYVSTMGGANLLYHNNGDGTFTDVAESSGVAEPIHSFPVWFWDYDNDGHLDLYVPTYKGVIDGVAIVAASYFGLDVPLASPSLFRGDGAGGFVDVATSVGLGRIDMPMGANFGDVDNDGWLDFYLGTGYPDYEALMPNALYHNLGGDRFADVTWDGGFGHLQKGHAIAFADFDHDGDLDIFAQMGGAFPGDRFSDAYYENPGFGHHWIALHLEGQTTNRSAIGARIELRVVEAGGRRSIFRHVTSGGSFGSSPLRQTIGLGRATSVERLSVYWPTSDSRQDFEDVAVDRFYRLLEGEARLEPLHLAATHDADG